MRPMRQSRRRLKSMRTYLRMGRLLRSTFQTTKKQMLESADKLIDAHFVSSREFLLCLTLQRPQSSKFQERLLDYTSQVGGHCKKPWQNCLSEPLAAELQRLMVVKEDKKKGKTEKKDKDKKDKKDSSEKKEKKSKADSKKVRKEDKTK